MGIIPGPEKLKSLPKGSWIHKSYTKNIKNEQELVTNGKKKAVAVEKVGFRSDYPQSKPKPPGIMLSRIGTQKRTERPQKKLRKISAAQGTGINEFDLK